jgi:hypothetical protein
MGGGIRRSHCNAAAVRFLAQAPAADHRCNRCVSRSLGRRGSALRRSDLDVFGCHDTAPDRRFDAMGLVLLLDRCEVVGIDPDGADLVTAGGARQRFRRRPLPPGTVSLWELTRRCRCILTRRLRGRIGAAESLGIAKRHDLIRKSIALQSRHE